MQDNGLDPPKNSCCHGGDNEQKSRYAAAFERNRCQLGTGATDSIASQRGREVIALDVLALACVPLLCVNLLATLIVVFLRPGRHQRREYSIAQTLQVADSASDED